MLPKKRMESHTQQISLKVLAEMAKHKEIYADLSFQANKVTRWSLADKQAWIESVFRGKTPHTIILVDVEACLEYAEENHMVGDIEYFSNLLNSGVRYLNVDGNNRVMNSYDFYYEDSVALRPDVYVIGDFNCKIEKSKNDTYTTLPEVVRNVFDEHTVTVQIYTNLSREECTELFISANSGVPLNHAERRNASTSEVANVIRNLAENYTDIFSTDGAKWFKDSELNRRSLDDFIAGLYMIYLFGHDAHIDVSSLYDMYRVDNYVSNSKTKAFEKHFRSFAQLIKNNKILQGNPKKNSLLDLYNIYTRMVKEKKTFKKGIQTKFCDEFLVVYKNLLKDKTLHELAGSSVAKTFEKMTGGRRSDSNVKRYELITKNLDLDKYFVQTSTSRSASPTTKFISAIDSGLLTPERKRIDLSKLHDGKTYHGGHKTPFADGGTTDVDNIVIQEARDNLKLGRKVVV